MAIDRSMTAMAYWYNVATRQVETDENRSAAADVLGPFETREEAEQSITAAHESSKKYDDEDAAWNEETSDDPKTLV